jgi:tetratricopeptide (TPR) repeat protein
VGAAAAALFFAVHPLRVESVAWVTERRDVLSGLFYVSTLLAYLKAVQGRARPRWGWYGGALGLFACALLSKSLTVSLPVALLVLDVYPLRRLGGRQAWGRRGVWLEKVPFLVLAGLAALVAFQALRALGNLKSLADMDLGSRTLVSLYGLAFYLWKTALPIGLSPLYDLSTVAAMGWRVFAPAALAVLVVTLLAILRRERWPAFSAAWVVYVATLLPVLGLFQNGPQIAADRYAYLACLGWAMLAGGGVARIADRASARGRATALEGWALGGATVAVVALVALTSWQTLVWRDSLTLWSRAVALDGGSAWAHAGLGFSHLGAGNVEEAMPHYREAVRLDPRLPEGLIGLAVGLSLNGHAEEAVSLARRAVGRSPDNAIFRHELGEVLRRAGRREQALEVFRETARLDPRWPASRYALAVTLAELGRREEAMAALEEAHRLARAQDSRDPEGERFAALVYVHFDTARALAAWQRYVEGLARIAEPTPGTVRRMAQALAAIQELRAMAVSTSGSR